MVNYSNKRITLKPTNIIEIQNQLKNSSHQRKNTSDAIVPRKKTTHTNNNSSEISNETISTDPLTVEAHIFHIKWISNSKWRIKTVKMLKQQHDKGFTFVLFYFFSGRQQQVNHTTPLRPLRQTRWCRMAVTDAEQHAVGYRLFLSHPSEFTGLALSLLLPHLVPFDLADVTGRSR